MYVEACFATFLGLVALTIMRAFEGKEGQPLKKIISVAASNRKEIFTELVRRLESNGVALENMDVEWRKAENRMLAKIDVTIPRNMESYSLVKIVEEGDGIEEIHVKERV